MLREAPESPMEKKCSKPSWRTLTLPPPPSPPPPPLSPLPSSSSWFRWKTSWLATTQANSGQCWNASGRGFQFKIKENDENLAQIQALKVNTLTCRYPMENGMVRSWEDMQHVWVSAHTTPFWSSWKARTKTRARARYGLTTTIPTETIAGLHIWRGEDEHRSKRVQNNAHRAPHEPLEKSSKNDWGGKSHYQAIIHIWLILRCWGKLSLAGWGPIFKVVLEC